MRITGGEFRSRKLLLPSSLTTRPTSDRTRQAVFNIIHSLDRQALSGAMVLDAFAGSGALGFEALSRGAAQATFIEKNQLVIKTLRQNIHHLGIESKCQVIQGDALCPPSASHPMNLVFLDPPYGKGLEDICLPSLQKHGWINAQSLIILETGMEPLPIPNTTIVEQRRYGAACISFLRYEA